MNQIQSEILFISDLHLTPERPFMIELFVRFVNERAILAKSLYILGDFFEYWIGDDDPAPGLESVFEAFNTLKKHNIPVYFMHGNRDFLISSDFEKRSHCQLIADPTKISINNTDIVLLHGDSLCTKDIKYQEFKKLVRSAAWQKEFTEQSIKERNDIVEKLRTSSQSETSSKAEEIMDVEQTAVEELFTSNNVTFMIHGHTHRPDIHKFQLNNNTATRIVLGDWYEHGSVLSIATNTKNIEYKLESFQ